MTAYWFGARIVDVLGYWTDPDLGLTVRFRVEGDPKPRCAFASMLQVAS